MAHDGTGEGWDTSAPAQGDARSAGAQEIRDLRKGVGIRYDKEHVDAAASSVGGEHSQGSAKAYNNASGSPPTERPDPDTPTNLTAADDGRLWCASDTQELKVYQDPSWITPTVGIGASGNTNISTDIKAVGGWTNSTGSPCLVIFNATGTNEYDLEINYGASWVKLMDSSALIGSSHQILMGSCIVPNGAKIRYNPAPSFIGRGRYQVLA